MTPEHEPLWTVTETSRFLSMSKQWVYKHAELGTLPCLRMGAALRFRPEAIRRYVADLERRRLVPLRPIRATPNPASE